MKLLTFDEFACCEEALHALYHFYISAISAMNKDEPTTADFEAHRLAEKRAAELLGLPEGVRL